MAESAKPKLTKKKPLDERTTDTPADSGNSDRVTPDEAVYFRRKFVVAARRKRLWVGILIAILNPVISGFIIAAFYLSEPDLKKEGMIVAAAAILWGVIYFYLLRQNLPGF